MEGLKGPSSSFKVNNSIKNSPSIKADPYRQLEAIQVYYGNLPGVVRTDRPPQSSGHPGTADRRQPKFHLEDFLNSEKQRREEADFRSPRPQRTCEGKKLPANIAFQGPGIPTAWRLDDAVGSDAGVLSHTDCGVSSSLPARRIQRRAVTDDELALWPLICPSDLRDGHELDRRDPSVAGDQGDRLPRRFPPGLAAASQFEATNHRSSRAAAISRLAHKPREDHPGASPGAGIPGRNVEHSGKSERPARKKDSGDALADPRTPHEEKRNARTISAYPGALQLRQLRDSPGAFALSPPPTIFGHVQAKQTSRTTANPREPAGRAGMVAGGSDLEVRPSRESDNALSRHGRRGLGLGSPVRRGRHLGSLEKASACMALQYKGDVRGLRRNQGPSTQIAEGAHFAPDGQPHSGSVYPKGGRHKVPGSTRPDVPAAGAGGRPPDNTIGGLSARKIQRHCRPAVPRKDTPGMALVATSNGRDLREMGRTRDRSVRFRKDRNKQAVRLERLDRSIRLLYRRIQSTVGVRASLGLPTSQPHSQSTSAPKQQQGTISRRGTQVGEDVLAVGLAAEEQGTADSNPRPAADVNRRFDGPTATGGGPTVSPGVESWGWSDVVRDWSQEERALLTASWRRSTVETYKAPLRRWIAWCSQHRVSPTRPRAQDLARFLAHLHLREGLAYSTILVHKSAVATFCTPAVNLASDFLVQQILKAIAVARPQEIRTEIWDASILMRWLGTRAERLTLFELSRRTAALLLLISGRRVHDLTLLKISPHFLQNLGKELVFWPAFGSKTDRRSFRQSGWQLSKHENMWLCPITMIRALLKMSEERRGGSEVDELFITLTGPVKAASRTAIAGWVRSALKEAGIEQSPGSIRSAVASRGWLDNAPIQEILNRGNWRSVETFRKHYYKEVRCQEGSTLPSTFRAV